MGYKQYRREALSDDPHCQRCGRENGVGHEALQWHHLTPQHTGRTDHREGVLLCRLCHSSIHRLHKVVKADGYSKDGLPMPKRQSVKRRQAEAQQLTEAYSP